MNSYGRSWKRLIIDSQPWWLAFLAGLILISANSRLQAQGDSETRAVTVAGIIASSDGQELTVDSRGGPLRIKLREKTVIRGEIAIEFSDITSGMYVGATATRQSDGTFRASRLHVFSEDQRGSSEGHRPLSSAPQSGLTMTNANVETVEDVTVQDMKGRMLTLKYQGGELKVLVPADIPVVKRVVGERSLLKPGAAVSVQAAQSADGTLSASQITVRAEERKKGPS